MTVIQEIYDQNRRWELPSEGRLTIGSAPDNDIVMPVEDDVRDYHATLRILSNAEFELYNVPGPELLGPGSDDIWIHKEESGEDFPLRSGAVINLKERDACLIGSLLVQFLKD